MATATPETDHELTRAFEGASAKLDRLREECRELERKAPSFTPFAVLGVAWSEIHHTRFLAHLLDPRGSHGQQNMFLDAFLELIGVRRTYDSERIRVVAEHHLGSAGQTDLVIFMGTEVVLLENKIGAAERENQITDYVTALEHPGRRVRAVLLSPNGRPSMTGEAVALSYTTLGRMILASVHELDAVAGTALLRSTLKAYADLCLAIGGSTGMETPDRLAEQLATPQQEPLLRQLLMMNLDGSLERVRGGILDVFWERVRAELQRRLVDHGWSTDWVTGKHQASDRYAKCGLYWQKIFDESASCVVAENIGGNPDYAWYGIRKPSGGGTQSHADRIAARLAERGFKANTYWLGWLPLDVQHEGAFRITRQPECLLDLHQDSLSNGSLASQVARSIWALFVEHRETLEALNRTIGTRGVATETSRASEALAP